MVTYKLQCRLVPREEDLEEERGKGDEEKASSTPRPRHSKSDHTLHNKQWRPTNPRGQRTIERGRVKESRARAGPPNLTCKRSLAPAALNSCSLPLQRYSKSSQEGLDNLRCCARRPRFPKGALAAPSREAAGATAVLYGSFSSKPRCES